MAKTETEKHPAAKAWDKWLASDEGQQCRAANTLAHNTNHYLENRLWRAFMAGAKSSPSDAEQLSELRKESLKGICVYCGEVQQYESLEQKSGAEGNRIRVEHIKRCPQRPELKLIAYCEELQRVASAALTYLEDTGESCRNSDLLTALRAVLTPQEEKEAQGK